MRMREWSARPKLVRYGLQKKYLQRATRACKQIICLGLLVEGSIVRKMLLRNESAISRYNKSSCNSFRNTTNNIFVFHEFNFLFQR